MTYDAKVVSTKEFGAFVEIYPGREGLVHISELQEGRTRRTEDVCRVGDPIRVKFLGADEKGRVRFSRKAVILDEKAAAAAGSPPPPAPEAPAAG
jgi:polyribonucleotide nucleotidyltransferase